MKKQSNAERTIRTHQLDNVPWVVIKLEIVPLINTPKMVPNGVPTPPLKRVPPITEAEIASIEANDETCEIGITFEKEEDRGRISLHYTYDNSYCYYDVLPQEVTDTDCIRQSEKADAIKISMEGGSLAMANPS